MMGNIRFNLSMRNGGFTLIEVMISLAIISIAIISLLGLRDRGVMLINSAEEINRASLVAQGIMNDFEINAPSESKREGEKAGFLWRFEASEIPVADINEWRLTLYHDNKEIVELVEYVPR